MKKQSASAMKSMKVAKKVNKGTKAAPASAMKSMKAKKVAKKVNKGTKPDDGGVALAATKAEKAKARRQWPALAQVVFSRPDAYFFKKKQQNGYYLTRIVFRARGQMPFMRVDSFVCSGWRLCSE